MSRHVPRIHFSIDGSTQTLCSTMPQAITDDRAQVTCRICTRRLVEVAVRAEAERDRRGDHPPAVLAGPGQSVMGSDGDRAIQRSIAGEPVTYGTRWGGLAAAWHALVLAQASRRSIASASSPDRFGRSGGHGSASTPTTPLETDADFVDIEMARDAACTAMRVGEHELTSVQVLAIAQARVVGRVAVKAVYMKGGTPVDDRGTWCDIRSVSLEEISDETGLTKHQVSLVVRRVSAAMTEGLARKGLIPTRAAKSERRESEGDDMAKAIGYDVSGWKSISALLEKSEDWCQKAAARSTEPMPVKRLGREVHANKAELLEWLRRQMRAA